MKSGLLIVVMLAVAALAGCGKGVSQADAITFNNALVDNNKRVTDAAQAFGQAAGAAIGGGIQEVAKAKREYENMVEAVARAKSDARTIKVPNSPQAKAFFEENEKLMKHQETMVNEDFRMIVKVLEDPLISPQERQKKIAPIARYVSSMDQGSIDGIKKAQADFAKAHNFKVK